MFNLIPLAGSRRKVPHKYCQTTLVCQLLQLPFPKPRPRSIATPRIRRDEERTPLGVGPTSHRRPPSSDAIDRERGRIMIHPDIDPPFVPRQIVYAIRDGLAFPWNQEIVHSYPSGLPFRKPFPPGVLEVPNQLLFLGIH